MKRFSQFTFALLLAIATAAMVGCPPASEMDSGDGDADVSAPVVTDGETEDGTASDG